MSEEVINENEYPKWIDHPTEEVAKTRDGKSIPKRILVKDAKEEAKYYPKKAKGWSTGGEEAKKSE